MNRDSENLYSARAIHATTAFKTVACLNWRSAVRKKRQRGRYFRPRFDRAQAGRGSIAPRRSLACTSTEAKPHRYLGFGRDDEALSILVGRELPHLGV